MRVASRDTLAAWFAKLRWLQFDERFARAAFNEQDIASLIAIEFTIAAIFMQTPGPPAGRWQMRTENPGCRYASIRSAGRSRRRSAVFSRAPQIASPMWPSFRKFSMSMTRTSRLPVLQQDAAQHPPKPRRSPDGDGPATAQIYRMRLRYLRTEDEGALFERMKRI